MTEDYASPSLGPRLSSIAAINAQDVSFMVLDYMRVSKADSAQTTHLQRDALLAAGVQAERFYEDHALGERDTRPGLDACPKALRDGDTLAIWKLDHLGRDLHHAVNAVHDLTKRGIGLKVLIGQAVISPH